MAGIRLIFVVIVILTSPAFAQESTARKKSAPVSYPVMSGVGLSLHRSDSSIRVFKVLPDSVAAKSKLIREGDEILSVQNGDKLVAVQGK
jgi:C-terminal processing protease CtpA/Prc